MPRPRHRSRHPRRRLRRRWRFRSLRTSSDHPGAFPAPAPPPPPTCTAGLVLRAGDSCTYPGTSQTLTVNADGTATFGFVTSGAAIDISSNNITLVATRQNDGSWLVQQVGAESVNRAPAAVEDIPDQTLTEGGGPRTIDVSANFRDPDGDALTYAATSSEPGIVRVTVSGSQLTLAPEAAGSATVTVTATDPGGESAAQRFGVTVEAEGETTPGGACSVGLVLGPGEFCTVDVPGVSVGTDRFEVRPDGTGCYGNLCSSQSLNLNGFEASRVPGADDWRIDAIPAEPGVGGEPTGGEDGCAIEDLGTLRGTTPTARTGTLDRDCTSPNEPGKLARYFSFTLPEAGAVQIDLESSDFDPLLFLREGSDITGQPIARNDDGGPGTNSRITRHLSPGTYTIEATSFRRDSRGRFTVSAVRTAGGESSSDALELVGELDCSVRDAGIPGSSLVNASIAGRFRALRNVMNVIVNGSFVERDGARSTHSLIPGFLGSIDAGDTEPFSLSGSFTTNATRFGCEVYLEWTEIRRGSTGFLKLAAPRSIGRSPRN